MRLKRAWNTRTTLKNYKQNTKRKENRKEEERRKKCDYKVFLSRRKTEEPLHKFSSALETWISGINKNKTKQTNQPDMVKVFWQCRKLAAAAGDRGG